VSDVQLPAGRGAAGVAPAARRRTPQPTGWWGAVLFLCAEVTLFGTMIGSYFYLDFDSHHWPPAGVPMPEILKVSVSTGVVVLMSIPMWRAAKAAQAGRRRETALLIFFAMFWQAAYLGFQIYLWRLDYLQFHPQGSAYGSIYFTLLTTDHAHVLLGILADASILMFILLKGLPRYQRIGVRGLAFYWHVVNVLIICVYLTLLSPRL